MVPEGSCRRSMARPRVAEGETAPIQREAVNILNKQSRRADKGWSSVKAYHVTNRSHRKPRIYKHTYSME